MTTFETLHGHIADTTIEHDALRNARTAAAEGDGTAVDAPSGALLSVLAGLADARTAVVVSPTLAVTGLWILRGMADDAILTSIDAEPEHQRAARRAFDDAGIPAARCRLITGRPLDVLPRLTDGAYDLVVMEVAAEELVPHTTVGLRLLRPGGALVLPGALLGGHVGDTTRHDPATMAAREALRVLDEDESVLVSRLPLGDGLVIAVRRG